MSRPRVVAMVTGLLAMLAVAYWMIPSQRAVESAASDARHALADAIVHGSADQLERILDGRSVSDPIPMPGDFDPPAAALWSMRQDSVVSPLVLSVLAGREDAATKLLQLGHPVDASPPGAPTAVMTAAALSQKGLLRSLLDAGADVSVKTRGGWAAITYATRSGDLDTFRAVLQAGSTRPPEFSSGEGDPFLFVDSHRSEGRLQMLLDAGLRPSASAVASYAQRGLLPELRQVVAAGISVEVRTSKGIDPLAEASRWGQTEAIEFLLDNGADVRGTVPGGFAAHEGWSALDFAADALDENAVRLLLRAGAVPTKEGIDRMKGALQTADNEETRQKLGRIIAEMSRAIDDPS